MLKKITGIILTILGIVSFLFLLLGIPNSFKTIMLGFNRTEGAFSWGFMASQIVFKLVLFAIAFLLFRFGRKLSKKPKES